MRLLVSYDGTDLLGWQVQTRGRTVQGLLESALGKVLKSPVRTAAAGRTDSGVHAAGQVVSFQTPKLLPQEAWIPALNSVLPRDIAVLRAEEVSPDFHARHSAISRSYRYAVVHRGPRSPLQARFASWVEGPLDLVALREVWSSLLGTHDFTHFASTGSDPVSPICRVSQAEIQEEGSTLFFHITADHFLYHMVRRLVGTALRVGRGVLSVEGFRNTWEGVAPRPSGPTAPPHGLTFVSVGYPAQHAWSQTFNFVSPPVLPTL
ncbi:MAG: tRNA pseudouridine(38-40) synthase TruA [Candidatus Sericytochromatia bacterium]|nr:tRNA pseudouridine(38-40) synthase TruA [Candidatus Sericytochromatia bacterium]